MQIKIAKSSDCKEFEVTDKALYLNRRSFIKSGLAAGAVMGAGGVLAANGSDDITSPIVLPDSLMDSFQNLKKTAWGRDETPAPFDVATSYNNFYEYGYGKEDPKERAHLLQPRPWKVAIEGEVAKPGMVDVDELIKQHLLEERIYRLRCVEAWSMVIPWVGIPLASIIKSLEPTSKAKYVYFETLYDPKQMPGQRSRGLDWPYREGLRMDEAMNPLAILAVGMYGSILANQNGAPLRLVVPWKYGFKSIKSIVKIKFVEQMPETTWNMRAPSEYGFYANVNPNVNHPRWSQARERRLPGGVLFPNVIETKMFNGYEEEVGQLYSGLDLERFY